jgi:hypothetical protein
MQRYASFALATILFALRTAHADPPLSSAPGCVERGWPTTVQCGTTSCNVTSCGEGKCPYCPIDELKNLVFKGWATYACMVNGENQGFAITVRTTPFNRLITVCVKD